MRLEKIALLMTAAMIVAGVSAPATVAQERRIHLGFGASLPQGDTGEFLKDGWTLRGGMTWLRPRSPIGYRLDFGVDFWDIDRSVLDTIDTNPSSPGIQSPDNGRARSWQGSVDLVWGPGSRNTVGMYLLAGVGVSYDTYHLSDNGYVPGYWCDWWWGVCYPGAAPGEYRIAGDSSWDWGYNAGVGITFRTRGGEVYLEGTYHWVRTENTAEFVPVTIGYRW